MSVTKHHELKAYVACLYFHDNDARAASQIPTRPPLLTTGARDHCVIGRGSEQ